HDASAVTAAVRRQDDDGQRADNRVQQTTTFLPAKRNPLPRCRMTCSAAAETGHSMNDQARPSTAIGSKPFSPQRLSRSAILKDSSLIRPFWMTSSGWMESKASAGVWPESET